MTAVIGAAVLATVLTAGAAQAQDYRFTMLTQTGIDNTFWQTITRGMGDACEDYPVDCQLLFTHNGDWIHMESRSPPLPCALGIGTG